MQSRGRCQRRRRPQQQPQQQWWQQPHQQQQRPTWAPNKVPAAAPAYVQPSTKPAECDSKLFTGNGVQVLLTGLPNHICTGPFMEAALEQAGLEGSIISCHVRCGKPTGDAMVMVTDKVAAAKCIGHFHGRRWDQTTAPVVASIARDNTEAPIPYNKTKELTHEESTDAGLSSDADETEAIVE
eukprot:gnl/TRDRNA2_/TRDRNA2_130095_c1_seq1.p1 gnl/TRDRNA2_/TRDRNA2_130095_c1~~gnl/TRDRNA2_/TRDRNA2_130095_c1_seq1.p1  ORF type:complete len:183 (-),score=46.47 gnl/TRDRNA2_/TRDRNA2_130095_c1_seq1:431-979(-)